MRNSRCTVCFIAQDLLPLPQSQDAHSAGRTIRLTTNLLQTHMIERIGINAGLVWNALDKLGKMDVKALRKATKLRSDKELFAAIGWLAKEGKLLFDESGEELLIELIY